MKTRFLIILLAMLTLNSCRGVARVKNTDCDPDMTRTISTFDPITSIENNTALDINVVTSPKYFVTLEGSETMLKYLDIDLRDGALVISYKKKYSDVSYGADAGIMVGTDALRQIINKGSGDITVPAFNCVAATILLLGSGDLEAGSVEATSLSLQIRGSGDASIGSVTTTSAKIILQGSGDVAIGKALTPSLDCMIQGSGDVNIMGIESNSVRAHIQGSGDIYLAGKTLSATYVVMGSGEINARNLKARHTTRSNLGSGDIYE